MKLKKKNKVKKVKPAKALKPVNKNSWLSRLKTWYLNLERRQQQHTVSVVTDDTVRTCSNCGEVYKGRVCPQCGQVGSWTRYSWRQAVLNFLDIWGLGNRPMFRTLRELFWRPGYMIRDYLGGHRNFYFPPFKLLALTVLLSLFVGMIAGGLEEKQLAEVLKSINLENSNLSPLMLTLAQALMSLAVYLLSNPLYLWLFIGAFGGLCIWIAFRKVGRYNFVETYVFLIFVLSQMLICRSVGRIGTAFYAGADKLMLTMMGGGGLLTVLSAILSVLLIIGGVIATVYGIAVFCLLLVDFKQFYGLSWKSLFKRLLVSMTVGVLVLIWFAVLITCLGVIEKSAYSGVLITALVLVPVAFVVADRIYSRSEAQVSPLVLRISKFSMLLVLYVFIMCAEMKSAAFNLAGSYALVVLYVAVSTCLSLLPVMLYKRFHNIWIASAPVVLLLVLLHVIP